MTLHKRFFSQVSSLHRSLSPSWFSYLLQEAKDPAIFKTLEERVWKQKQARESKRKREMKIILLQIESAMTWPVTELKNLPQTFVPGLTAMAMADRAKVVPPGIYNDTSNFWHLQSNCLYFSPMWFQLLSRANSWSLFGVQDGHLK